MKNAKFVFSRRVTYMILVKKLMFFPILCLSNTDRGKVFANLVDRKEAFQDY